MKMKIVVLVLALCAVAFAIRPSNDKKTPKTNYTAEEVEAVCSNLKKGSLFHQLKCALPGDDPAKFGKAFIKNHPEILDPPATLAPVVLLPGFGGSALEARLTKHDSPAWYCFETYDWFRLWLALSELLAQPCWTDNLKIYYEASNDTYHNTDGVEIRGMDFGGVSGIDYLDYVFGFPVPFTSYYATLVQSLEAVGYQPGVNLHGVTYDFRLPPDADIIGDLYARIQQLIETTYANNGNTKVHVVTHSMGGPMFLYMLNQLPQSWKDQYLASFIPIAGPWSGSPKALKGLISGDDFGLELMGFSLADKIRLRNAIRQAGGLVFMVPDPDFWPRDQVFVYTADTNYTASDMIELFQAIGTNETVPVYQAEGNFIPHLVAPNVETYCIYGTNDPTEIAYHYPDNNFDADPTLIDYTQAGDGVVPLQSLMECTTWAQTQTQPVHIHESDTGDHVSILDDEDVINYVLAVVTGTQPKN